MNLSSSPRRPRFRPFLSLLLAAALAAAGAGLPAAARAQKAGAAKKEAVSGGKRRLPPDEQLKDMVRKTLLDLDKGLETKEFSQLHASLAPTWRRQISKDQLSLLFAKQLDENQRTDYAANNEVVFDPAPAFDANGLLVLSGHVPSLPQSVVFRIKYYNEDGYKPFGIAVRVQNADKAPSRLPLPGEKEESLPPGKGAAAAAAALSAAPPNAAPAAGAAALPGYVSPFASPAASPAATASPTPGPGPNPSPAASP